MDAQNDCFTSQVNAIYVGEKKFANPVCYQDGIAAYFYFRTAFSLAADLLEEKHLIPVSLPKKKALAGIAFFDYFQSDLGPYREAALVILAHPKREKADALSAIGKTARRKAGFYVVHLPVTTALADSAGREVWSLPKYVTSITLKVAPKVFAGSIGKLSIQAKLGHAFPGPCMDLLLLTPRGEQIERTSVETQGTANIQRVLDFTIEGDDPTHSFTPALKHLGFFNGLRPLCYQRIQNFKARLYAPVC